MKPDPPDKSGRPDHSPARPRTLIQTDTDFIYIFFSGFGRVMDFPFFVGYPPDPPDHSLIPLKKKIATISPRFPPHPNHFSSLSTSRSDHLSLFSHFRSLFSHFRPSPSLSLSLRDQLTMSPPRRNTNDRSLGREVAGVGRRRRRTAENKIDATAWAHLISLFSSTVVAGSGEILPDLVRSCRI